MVREENGACKCFDVKVARLASTSIPCIGLEGMATYRNFGSLVGGDLLRGISSDLIICDVVELQVEIISVLKVVSFSLLCYLFTQKNCNSEKLLLCHH